VRTRTKGPARKGGRAVAALALALLSLRAAPAAAQTPATAPGLGQTVPAADARAAAMGGARLGLIGGSLSVLNPADLTGFSRPALGMTISPEGVSVKTEGGSQGTGRSRVPVVVAVVPRGSWAFGASFVAETDQDWSIQLSDTLSTAFGTFPFEERREHDGGLSSVNLTVARTIGSIGAGIEAGFLTGGLRQTFFRNFETAIEDPTVGIGVARGEARFGYSAFRLRGGLATQLSPGLRVSGMLSWTGDLEAKQDTAAREVARYEIPMPVEWALGGSYRVASRLLVSAAGGWAGWGGSGDAFVSSEASDVWWLGVGAEWLGLRLFGAGLPVRAGFRRTGLPFHPVDRDPITETAFTFGAGIDVAGGIATMDAALELGSRGDLAASGVEESFTRFSLSLSVTQP
jgi:hypothetical protein